MNALDHLVLATPQLSETVAHLTRLVGVEPVPGGRHVGRGTRNFLLGLGAGGYLEIIGPDPEQPEPESPRPFGVDELTGPRLVAWAIGVTDIDAAVTAARAAGFDPGDPSEMSRATPGGETLRWRLTLDRGGRGTGIVPFLIDWGSTRHPALDLPQAKLLSLTAVHPDVATTSALLQAVSAAIELLPGIRPALIATLDGPHGPVTLV
ncbi:VOC family protein [Nocardia transvalensis]|uniref:VOC family protein n=1 Tax=Nocardia transvalensis TaxID=37333 RepID=UPI002B4B3DD5|nr:VOC family protein [Nocardia transvalensis]